MEQNRNRILVVRAMGDIDLQYNVNKALNLMKKQYGGKLDHIDYLQDPRDNEYYTAIIHYLLPKDYLKKTIKSIKDLKKKGKKKIKEYKEKRANKSV